jgi:uncharacterized OsmC-like protein
MNQPEDWDEKRVRRIDVDALSDVMRDVERDPAKAKVEFRVKTVWQGAARSETSVESYSIGGNTVPRKFKVVVDEPEEMLGGGGAINPHELLMSALNSCLMVSYAAGAAIKGIDLESIEIETEGELDLRGFLGLDRGVSPGHETLRYTVRIKGDGTPEEFREIHETVMTTSPNFFNIAQPIRLEPTLVVG